MTAIANDGGFTKWLKPHIEHYWKTFGSKESWILVSVGGSKKLKDDVWDKQVTKKQLLRGIAREFDKRRLANELTSAYKSNSSHYELFPADFINVTEDLIDELDKIQATYALLQHPESQVREKDAVLAAFLNISHLSYVIRDITRASVANAQL